MNFVCCVIRNWYESLYDMVCYGMLFNDIWIKLYLYIKEIFLKLINILLRFIINL